MGPKIWHFSKLNLNGLCPNDQKGYLGCNKKRFLLKFMIFIILPKVSILNEFAGTMRESQDRVLETWHTKTGGKGLKTRGHKANT